MDLNLYNYLHKIVGTEDIVQIRRSFFNILESYYNEHTIGYRVIFSGSKAEGLDLQGSDVDIMIIHPLYTVYESEADSNTECIIMDTDNASPGFAFLKPQRSSALAHLVVDTDSGKMISNEKFKLFYLNNEIYKFFDLHGPCLSTPKGDLDLAFCFQCKTWPSIALPWISRSRSRELSQDLILEIVHEGVLFVPIGSKFGSQKGNPYEWRLSFSQAEKRLVHSFNHTELLCYALLKIVLRDLLNQNTMLKGLLCSYFIKTAMFWLKEELPYYIWKPKSLMHCFKECLKRILYWIECGYCPNYFVPENNMFAGKFDNIKLKAIIVKTLQDLCEDYITLFTNSKPLYGFLRLKTNGKKNQAEMVSSNKVFVFDACIFPLFHISKFIYVEQTNNEILKTIFPILERNRYSKQKRKFSNIKNFKNDFNIATFAEVCRRSCHTKKYKFYKRNKVVYINYKNLLSHLLIGANSGLNAWLSISVFFYQHKQYNSAIQAAEYLIAQTTPDMFIAGQYGIPYTRPVITSTKSYEELPLIQRFKLTCKEPYMEICFPDTFLHGCNLASMAFGKRIISNFNKKGNINHTICMCCAKKHASIPDYVHSIPETFGHFIRFMCFQHQHDNVRKNLSLNDMIESIVSHSNYPFYRLASFPYLLSALGLSDNVPLSDSWKYATDICC